MLIMIISIAMYLVSSMYDFEDICALQSSSKQPNIFEDKTLTTKVVVMTWPDYS